MKRGDFSDAHRSTGETSYEDYELESDILDGRETSYEKTELESVFGE